MPASKLSETALKKYYDSYFNIERYGKCTATQCVQGDYQKSDELACVAALEVWGLG